MRAAVLRAAGGPLVIEDVTLADLAPREVRVVNRAVGICHSDLHFADGTIPCPLPTILGHEAAGIVVAVGSEVRGLRRGDHVVTCLSAFCGHCASCASGRLVLCSSGETKRPASTAPRLSSGGEPIHQFLNISAFAEEMIVHENACVAIRPDMPFDRAALLGCAVTTGVGAAVNTANVRPGQSVAVIGCGGVGLSAIAGAHLAGAGRIIAIDRQQTKLDLARRFGATDTLLANEDFAHQLIEETCGGVDHAIEAIGRKETVETAFAILRPGGCATVAGMMPPGVKLEIDGFALLGERRLQGSNMGSNQFPRDIPNYANLYMQGRLNLDDLIARRISLDDIDEAFDALRLGRDARSVVMFA